MEYIPEEILRKMDVIASVVLDDMIRLKKTRLYITGDSDQNLELFASYWNLNLVTRIGSDRYTGEEKKVLESLLKTPVFFDTPMDRDREIYQADVGRLVNLKNLVS